MAAVVVLATAGLLAWFFVGRNPSANMRSSPSVRRLLTSPETYYGHLVIVTGTVSAVYNHDAITLGAPLKAGLLVTGRDVTGKTTVRPNAVVRVTGVAARFNLAEWERRTGSRSDLRVLRTFDGGPVVRVKSIQRVGPAGLQESPTNPAEPKIRPAPSADVAAVHREATRPDRRVEDATEEPS